MEEIKIKNVNETIYHETFSSGLNVYVYPTDLVSNYNIELMVNVGSIDNHFKLNDEEISVPDGVAHFLEHLTFNTEDGPAEEFFSKTGAYSNAFTDFDKTVYVCRSKDNFKDNLVYLLDYVNTPFYNNELVEKERGIIIEEVSMYENDPYQKLFYGLLSNLLINDKHRKPVGGNVSDVKDITLEDIKNVYYTFYQKYNMNLIITGNVDVNEIMNIISNYEKNKEIIHNDIVRIPAVEKDEVYNNYSEIYENVVSSKACFGFKVSKNKLNLSNEEGKISFNILSSLLFGETSLLREKLENNNLINDELGFYTFDLNDYFLLVFDFESEEIDEVIDLIKKSLNLSNINENDLSRKKKVYISNMIRRFENINAVSSSIENSIAEFGRVLDDEYDIVNNINVDKLSNLVNAINDSPYSLIKLLPKK